MSTLLDRIDTAPADAVAVLDDRQALNYGQLRDTALRISRLVRGRYDGEGYIMLPAHPTVDFVATLLGVMYSGNTPIPIAADLPADSVEFIRQKSNRSEEHTSERV